MHLILQIKSELIMQTQIINTPSSHFYCLIEDYISYIKYLSININLKTQLMNKNLTTVLIFTVLLINYASAEHSLLKRIISSSMHTFQSIHKQMNPQSIIQQPNNDSLIFMIEELYYGEYVASNSDLFNYLGSTKGKTYAFVSRNPFGNTNLQIDIFQMWLYDPEYHDQRAVKLRIQLDKMASKNEWNSTNSKIKVTKQYKERVDSQEQDTFQYRIFLENIDNKQPQQVIMNVQMKKNNALLFKAQLNFHDAKMSTALYCLYSSLVVGLQIMSAYFLLKKIDTVNPNIINKISLTTMTACNIEDFYLTMANIQYVMTSKSSFYFFYILPSIGYVVLFVIFDMKLLFLAWRSHYMRQIDNPQDLRKKLTTFYIKFYVGLFLYLTLVYFFSYDVWMIILQNMLLLPQIVHNIRTGINPGFEPFYILGFMATKFLLPLYERSCPSNHFVLTPMIGLVITLFLLYAIQILILFLQYKFGPRFLIPKIFQPDYYDYNFKIKPNEQNKDMQCSICLQNFFVDPTNINVTQIQQPIISKQKTIMKTPCNHLFHKQCLTNWADVKLECPSCRAPLPPM